MSQSSFFLLTPECSIFLAVHFFMELRSPTFGTLVPACSIELSLSKSSRRAKPDSLWVSRVGQIWNRRKDNGSTYVGT
ncbi:hypothetical protein F5Y09DRAFT_326534 [Xylaria sp. FL1042]|nr:hypothetical protein F5Y09DRAFT_326534 [Xylaria sp. FL1042]